MKERDRLNRIIRLKERLRDAETGRLAAAEAEQRRADDAVRAKEAQVIELSVGMTQTGEVNARELSNLASLHAFARRERESLVEVSTDAAQTRDLCAAELARAARELRRFEVLDARYTERDRVAERRREQAALDESARRLGATG